MNKMTASLLKPEHLAPIRNLSLRAKLIVEGTMAGLHRSPYHGFSAEFLEYRQYLAGESAKRIDWRKFAKTDRSFVKLFEDETNLFATILVDKSASMGLKINGPFSKFDYACTLAASLAWILVRQKDAVGFAAFDQTISVSLPPRSTNLQLKNMLGILDKLTPGLETKCGNAIDQIASTMRKRGLSILISDLYDDPDEVIRGLRHLRFKRQDVIVICVLDPFEIDFKENNTYRFQDLETGKIMQLDGVTARKFFKEGQAAHRMAIESACKELRIDVEIISTQEPFQRALFRILEKRRRMF